VEGGDDVLVEEIDLADLLFPRHESWSKNQPNHSRSRSPPSVFSCSIRTAAAWSAADILGILGQAERLGKAEAAEIMVEAGVIGLAEQRHRLLLGTAEMDRAETPDALAEA